MAITQAFTNQCKQDLFNGVHQPGDVYKIALYTSAATLDKATTAYTATNEVASGGGYTTGGNTLSGFTVSIDTDTAYIDWTADPSWPTASFTARGAMIYNSTRSNKALAIFDFGSDKTSSGGTFAITLPAAAAGTALIRMA
jgi:hypothetical protein